MLFFLTYAALLGLRAFGFRTHFAIEASLELPLRLWHAVLFLGLGVVSILLDRAVFS